MSYLKPIRVDYFFKKGYVIENGKQISVLKCRGDFYEENKKFTSAKIHTVEIVLTTEKKTRLL